MMENNTTATLTQDEIVIKLDKMEAMIKLEKGQGQEALLFAKGNAKANGNGNGKCRKSGKGDESDKDQDRKGKPMCFYCHKNGHTAWNCQSKKRGEPQVTKECTETAAKNMDDIITTSDSAEMMTTIENDWVPDTGTKTASWMES